MFKQPHKLVNIVSKNIVNLIMSCIIALKFKEPILFLKKGK